MTPETSLGFSAIEFATEILEIEPLPWQRWLLIHALELRPDGRFRFRTVLIMVARQNGKTTLVEIKNLWKMFVLRVPLIISTAQDLDTAEESWEKATEIAEAIPDLAEKIVNVNRTNGKKALIVEGGSRWKIKAASRRAGRGLSGDDVNFDELREHQTWGAWGAVSKTTMARKNAQIWSFTNAGDDLSVVLNALQRIGKTLVGATDELLTSPGDDEPEDLDGQGEDGDAEEDDPFEDLDEGSFGYFDWSARPDVRCTCTRRDGEQHHRRCRLWDTEAWCQANPSLGYPQGISAGAIVSALETDPEPVFRTEVMCQRVETMVPGWRVIKAAWWERATRPTSKLVGRPAYGVYVPPDRSWAAIGAAGDSSEGGWHMEITGDGEMLDFQPGTAWVVERLKAIEKHQPSVLIIDDKALADEAEKAGLKVHRALVGDMVTGCQRVYDALVSDGVSHIGQKPLTDAAKGADKRNVGGSWAWARHDLDTEISPLAGVSLALAGHTTPARHRPKPSRPMAVWR